MFQLRPVMSYRFHPIIGILFVLLLVIFIGNQILPEEKNFPLNENLDRNSIIIGSYKIKVYKNILHAIDMKKLTQARELVSIMLKGQEQIVQEQLNNPKTDKETKIILEGLLEYDPSKMKQ